MTAIQEKPPAMATYAISATQSSPGPVGVMSVATFGMVEPDHKEAVSVKHAAQRPSSAHAKPIPE
jgi:hypothetical protein